MPILHYANLLQLFFFIVATHRIIVLYSNRGLIRLKALYDENFIKNFQQSCFHFFSFNLINSTTQRVVFWIDILY